MHSIFSINYNGIRRDPDERPKENSTDLQGLADGCDVANRAVKEVEAFFGAS